MGVESSLFVGSNVFFKFVFSFYIILLDWFCLWEFFCFDLFFKAQFEAIYSAALFTFSLALHLLSSSSV